MTRGKALAGAGVGNAQRNACLANTLALLVSWDSSFPSDLFLSSTFYGRRANHSSVPFEGGERIGLFKLKQYRLCLPGCHEDTLMWFEL